MKTKILLSFIVVALLSWTVMAGEFLDVNQPDHTTIWGGPIGEKQLQTFTTGPSTTGIIAFEWKTWNPSGIGDTVQVDLREYYFDVYGMDNGVLLGTKTMVFEGAADSDWLRVDFDTPIEVVPNTAYMMFITNIAGYAGYYRAIDAVEPIGEYYTGGWNARVDNTTTGHWGVQANSDLAFRIYGYIDESKAHTPTPVSPSTVDIPEGSTLSWLMGEGAVTHKVYWSDDDNAVINRSVTPIVLTQAVDGNTTPTPSTPVRGVTYYWAVDEVNSVGGTADGLLWNYTIRDFVYVDDFEAYDGSVSSGNDVWQVWVDGYPVSPGLNNGSAVHSVNDGADGTVKAMEYQYSNNGQNPPYGGSGYPYYSEIMANTSDPCLSCGTDWTAEGVAWLELKFKGQAGNDANERMYVVIEDSTGANSIANYGLPDTNCSNPSWLEDMNNINDDVWRRWGIDLRAFTGVNLADVQKVYVGFGERGKANDGSRSGAPAGQYQGTVIFDEFKLRSPGIHSTPDVWDEDLYNDGTINYRDLAFIGILWLETESDGTWPQL